MILVELGEVLRHLALAEGVVERVVDQLRLDAEAAGGVAIDGQDGSRGIGLLVGRDVASCGKRLQLVQHSGANPPSSSMFGVLQRVLELRCAPAGRPC